MRIPVSPCVISCFLCSSSSPRTCSGCSPPAASGSRLRSSTRRCLWAGTGGSGHALVGVGAGGMWGAWWGFRGSLIWVLVSPRAAQLPQCVRSGCGAGGAGAGAAGGPGPAPRCPGAHPGTGHHSLPGGLDGSHPDPPDQVQVLGTGGYCQWVVPGSQCSPRGPSGSSRGSNGSAGVQWQTRGPSGSSRSSSGSSRGSFRGPSGSAGGPMTGQGANCQVGVPLMVPKVPVGVLGILVTVPGVLWALVEVPVVVLGV